MKKLCAGRCWARKPALVLCSIYWTCPGALYHLDVIVGQYSPKCFCSYCVYFDICPSTTQSVCFDTYSIVIVLTSGHAGGWINTSVSCLVKRRLLFLAMGTLTLVSLVLFTTIVLTGGQKWSFYE